MNWSGGGKKRFRTRAGPHVTKPLFRHQNRIPLFDDHYIEKMISKSTKDKKRSTSHIKIDTKSTPEISNRKKDEHPSLADQKSPTSLFGDIPLGTPSERPTATPHRDDLCSYGKTASQGSEASDISCITIQDSQPNRISPKTPDCIPKSAQSFYTDENESGLFEGDELSNYCSPEESDASFFKVNCYLNEAVSQCTAESCPRVQAYSLKLGNNNTSLSDNSSLMRKHVRYGGVSVEDTPIVFSDYSSCEDKQTYRKTPVVTPEILNGFSNEKSEAKLFPDKNSNSSGRNQEATVLDQVPWLQSSPRKNGSALYETVIRNAEYDSGSQTNGQTTPQSKKHTTQYLKTKKKLIFKKVILREKVIHKTFKIIKTRDTSTQTSP